MRALVVGLDAATWRVLDPLLEAGRLPNLSRLVDDGASGTLQSTKPPMTPLAWTSAATGVGPEDHGIYDFFAQDTETYRIDTVDYAGMTRPAVWDVCRHHDTTVGVVNFPLAYPPPEVDGFFLSGIPATAEHDIYRPEAVGDVLAGHDYRLHSRVSHDEPPERYLEEVMAMTTVRREATLDLLDRFDPDLLWPVFMGIDWIQHYLWHTEVNGRPAVERIYEHVDAEIGHLLDAVPDDTPVVVLSDHGARPVTEEIHLNALLERWGYLARVEDTASPSFGQRVGRVAWGAASRLPSSTKQLLKRVLPRDLLRRTSSRIYDEPNQLDGVVDWSETTAFSYGSMGRIFLHDELRYADGVVSAAEYETVRRELEAQFAAAEHPETGEPLFAAVHRGEDVYGVRGDRVPDLLLEPVDWQYAMYGDLDDAWIREAAERVADHEPEGVLVLAGEPFRHADLDAEIADVAPTLLHLLGLPVVEDMTGQVCAEAFTDAWQDRPIERVASEHVVPTRQRPTADDRGEMKDRLEDLGYL